MLQITVCSDFTRVWRVKECVCQLFEVCQYQFASLSLPCEAILTIKSYRHFLFSLECCNFFFCCQEIAFQFCHIRFLYRSEQNKRWTKCRKIERGLGLPSLILPFYESLEVAEAHCNNNKNIPKKVEDRSLLLNISNFVTTNIKNKKQLISSTLKHRKPKSTKWHFTAKNDKLAITYMLKQNGFSMLQSKTFSTLEIWCLTKKIHWMKKYSNSHVFTYRER